MISTITTYFLYSQGNTCHTRRVGFAGGASSACRPSCPRPPSVQSPPTGPWSHLVRGPVLLAAASGGLLVVLAHVHHLSLGALSDQVSAHAGDILKAVAWQGEGRGGRGQVSPSALNPNQKASQSALYNQREAS